MYYYNDMRNFKREEEGDTGQEGLCHWDKYDDQMYLTDCVLSRVRKAIGKADTLYERCVRMRTKLESVGSFDYEEIGKLGCRVSSGGGCADTGSKVIRLIDMEEQYAEALAFVEEEKQALKAILKECPSITDVERMILFHRWDSVPAKSFDEVAELTGLRTYHMTWQRYKKAYAKFAMWVLETDYILPYVA